MKEKCANCKYWDSANEDFGSCCRHPPVLDVLQVEFAKSNGYGGSDSAEAPSWWIHPTTVEDLWCSEWALRPKTGGPHS